MAAVKRSRVWAWLFMLLGALYFFVPLLGTFEFSLRYQRGVYSLAAYQIVLTDPHFRATFAYSTILAFATIVVCVLLVVPTAYWIQLRLPGLRPVVEFVTLLPLVIPAVVLVFGYLRIYNSASWLPLTGSATATDLLLTFGYVSLALPYMYRAVDNGLRAIDVRTLTEAAESLGANWGTILLFAQIRGDVLHNQNLGYALALGMILITGLSNAAYIWLRARSEKWLR